MDSLRLTGGDDAGGEAEDVEADEEICSSKLATFSSSGVHLELVRDEP